MDPTASPISDHSHFSMCDLNHDFVVNELDQGLTEQVFKAGLSAIINTIIEKLLQRDGKCIYYLNPLNNMFEMRIKNNNGKIVSHKDSKAICPHYLQ